MAPVLHVIDSPLGVRGVLILRCISDQPLLIVESHVGWRYSVTLIIDENLDLSILHHAHARVGRAQINTDY